MAVRFGVIGKTTAGNMQLRQNQILKGPIKKDPRGQCHVKSSYQSFSLYLISVSKSPAWIYRLFVQVFSTFLCSSFDNNILRKPVVGYLIFFLQQSSFMSEFDTQVPSAFDPFADANAEDSGAGTKEYVHVRVQQRNGRKSLTTVQGLKKEYSYNKILKDLKKEFCCNGTVVEDPELGQVIQLQGDQRKNVSSFLVQAGIVKKEDIKLHGF
ncbi:protein translation factor SUI1 homolog [Prunus yedoensis var. nudiflora]|uniref:Protein translation factor SUI1 homolog n=5 Tax=Prunus TaxID=3754 RepID=A0A314ZHV9_PRUYE|nr:protein translation factor SUI1 homolog [Prunus yedoensis var. nudiflora]